MCVCVCVQVGFRVYSHCNQQQLRIRNLRVSQVALSWGVARGTPVLPKSVNEERIKQNLLAPEQVQLDAEDMAAIAGVTLRYRYLKQEWFLKPEEVPADHWDGEE